MAREEPQWHQGADTAITQGGPVIRFEQADAPFLSAGIPVGGLLTGGRELKPQSMADMWGGKAGEPATQGKIRSVSRLLSPLSGFRAAVPGLLSRPVDPMRQLPGCCRAVSDRPAGRLGAASQR